MQDIMTIKQQRQICLNNNNHIKHLQCKINLNFCQENISLKQCFDKLQYIIR